MKNVECAFAGISQKKNIRNALDFGIIGPVKNVRSIVKITINGHVCTKAEIMTMKSALTNFTSDLNHGAMGEDKQGEVITRGYINNIKGLLQKLQTKCNKVDRIKAHKKIAHLPGTLLEEDGDPNHILSQAYDEVESVVILGIGKDGDHYFASSVADGAEILWLLKKLELKLLTEFT